MWSKINSRRVIGQNVLGESGWKPYSIRIINGLNFLWKEIVEGCIFRLLESMPTGEKSKPYKENMEYKRGNSWKSKLKYNADRAIWSSVTFDEFLLKMQEAGYEIRHGKHLAFHVPEPKHFTNVKTLWAYYTEDSILQRLEKNRHKARIPQNASYKVRMFVQMTSYVSDGNRSRYEQWTKQINLKEATKTFNYLSKHNLLNYEEFQNHISDLGASIHVADEKINQTQQAIQKQKVIQKHCEVYWTCRDVVRAVQDPPNNSLYRKQHQTI